MFISRIHNIKRITKETKKKLIQSVVCMVNGIQGAAFSMFLYEALD